MINVDMRSSTPIYEQIVEEFKNLIISGVLVPDEKIPSVRELARMLTINPNTIQKAYKELENQGYVYTASGRGKFVNAVESTIDQKKMDELLDEIYKVTRELKYMGISREILENVIEDVFNEGDK